MEFQPVKPTFEFLFQATVNVGAPTHISKVPLGERRFIPITGGSFIGEKLSGDVHPSGKSMNVCDSIRRIRPGRPASEPDGTIKVRIELWPTAHMFKRGHRIRVQVSSGAFPRFARNLGTGQPLATGVDFPKAEQKIYHDPAHPSAITLPTKRYM
jgi:hypothetical protein